MLSGRGIDGELKSKFGEWSEKFWKSSSWGSPSEAKNVQAIYFANEGGGSGSGGEGKELRELKRDSGKSLISTGSGRGDQVESAFGYCVGAGQRDGINCKDSQGKFVVMVGSDLDTKVTWEELKEPNWGQTSLVRSGRSYTGLFKGKIWKGNSGGEESKLNRQKVQSILIHQGKEEWMRDIMCPWIWSADDGNLRQLKERCGRFSTGSGSLEGVNLIGFLNSNRARKYFKANAWDWRDNDWEYLALLTLLNLWTNALSNVNFDGAANLLSNEVDKFKLENLMNSNGKVIYLSNEHNEGKLKAISYHSGGNWKVQLCPSNGDCSDDKGLNLTLGDGKFCIVNVICLDRGLSTSKFATLRSKMNGIYNSGSGTWGVVFGSGDGKDHLKRLLIALVVACFSDVKNVSLSVQEPSERGELIFTYLKEKR